MLYAHRQKRLLEAMEQAFNVNCGLWDVDYVLWTVDCGLCTVDCVLWTVECGLRNVYCRVRISLYGV